MNIDPCRRDVARLVAVADAVGDLAEAGGDSDLARFVRSAAQRFQSGVLSADPHALAVARFEVDRLLANGLSPAAPPAAGDIPAPAPGR